MELITSSVGLKIKTLEEIKAEKELKKKMQEDEMKKLQTNEVKIVNVSISKEEQKPAIVNEPALNRDTHTSENTSESK